MEKLFVATDVPLVKNLVRVLYEKPTHPSLIDTKNHVLEMNFLLEYINLMCKSHFTQVQTCRVHIFIMGRSPLSGY